MNDDTLQTLYLEMVDEITVSIDNETLCSIMVTQGWTQICIDCSTDTKYVEVLAWIRANVQGQFKGRYDCWVFESRNDATLFQLTWG